MNIGLDKGEKKDDGSRKAESFRREQTFGRRLGQHKARQQEGGASGESGRFQLCHPVRGQTGHQVDQVLQRVFGLVLLGLFQSGHRGAGMKHQPNRRALQFNAGATSRGDGT